MSIESENVLVSSEENSEAVRQDNAGMDAALVEMGKVSDTQGGWFGAKPDSGAGLAWS